MDNRKFTVIVTPTMGGRYLAKIQSPGSKSHIASGYGRDEPEAIWAAACQMAGKPASTAGRI